MTSPRLLHGQDKRFGQWVARWLGVPPGMCRNVEVHVNPGDAAFARVEILLTAEDLADLGKLFAAPETTP